MIGEQKGMFRAAEIIKQRADEFRGRKFRDRQEAALNGAKIYALEYIMGVIVAEATNSTGGAAQ